MGVSTASDAIAGFVVMKTNRVALAPTNFTPVDLGALPVAGTTAIAAVDRFARVRPAERVLVRGGAGGVESAAVQLAHARGVLVTALASRETEPGVLALGADLVLDYRETDPESLPKFDVIIDTVGTDLARYRQLLAKGGPTGDHNRGFPPPGSWRTGSPGLVGSRPDADSPDGQRSQVGYTPRAHQPR